MDTQTIINRIASLVGLDKQVKLGGDVYGKLEDGAAVATDSFEVGSVLFVLSEEGNKSLAPDADHKIYLPTSNGSKLFQITTVGGVITSLDLAPNPGKELNMKQENLAMGPNETKVNPDMIEGEKPEIDKEIDTEKITMQEDVKSMMDAMSAEIKQLRDDIANIYSKMEGKSEEEDMEKVKMEAESFNEESKVKDILKGGVGVGGQGKPNDGGPSKYNMSAQKKFTGAPAAEAKPLEGLFKSNKVENAMSRVFSKMANSKI
jgi:gas vesicle protein